MTIQYYTHPGYSYPLLLDTASRPYGPAVRASIYNGVSRYLSDGGTDLPGKLLLPDEAASYLECNQAVVSNWETTADMMERGYEGGKWDANAAWAQHKACGGPDNTPIYFSCDFDAREDQQNVINAYLLGAMDTIGANNVGIYADYFVLKRVVETYPHLYLWQTEAWSGGNVLDGLHLYQRNDLGIADVNNCQCDVNEIRNIADFGQWNTRIDGTHTIGDVDMVTNLKSLVDGSEHTPEEFTQFIDLHTYRTYEIVKRIAEKNNVDITGL